MTQACKLHLLVESRTYESTKRMADIVAGGATPSRIAEQHNVIRLLDRRILEAAGLS